MKKHVISINLSDEKEKVVGGDVTKYICIYDPNHPLKKHNEHTIEFSLDEWSHELLMRTPSVIFSALRWGTDEMIESLKSRRITPVEASIVLKDFGVYLSMKARKLKQDMEKESECSVSEFINRISNISKLEKDVDNQNKNIIAFYIASDIVIRMATMIVRENAFQKEDERLYPKYRDVIKAYENVYKLSREEVIYRKRRMWKQWVPQVDETFDECQDTRLFDRVCTEDMKTYEKCLTETTHGVVSAYRNIAVDLECGYVDYIENEVTQKIVENMIVQYMPLDNDIDIQERSVQAASNNAEKILTEIKKAVVGPIKNIEVGKGNVEGDKKTENSKDKGFLPHVHLTFNSDKNSCELSTQTLTSEEFKEYMSQKQCSFTMVNIEYQESDPILTNINRLIIYDNDVIPPVNTNVGDVFVSRNDWKLMQNELNPIALLITLLYSEEERHTLLYMHDTKTLATAIEKLAIVMKNDTDENMAHDNGITIRPANKVVALLLTYAYAYQKDIKYNNLEEVRQRINELSLSDLRQFISDMLKEIEKSGD